MLYICVPARNDAKTIGLLLWKVRQVFADYPREYQLLVADDGSQDDTLEVLERYQHALTLSVIRHSHPRGYAATLEVLFRQALESSDRLKRDCIVTLNADFSVSPAVLPEMIRRFESGADVVIAEAIDAEPTPTGKLVRRAARWLLRPGLQLPGVTDLLSGVCAIRLITLRQAMRSRTQYFDTDGPCAIAELLGRSAAHARQIAVVAVPSEQLRSEVVHDHAPFALAMDLFRAGRHLRLPEPEAAISRS